MKNTIVLRVFDFLKAYPPFSLLSKEALLEICARVVVQYRPPGETIFHQGDPPGGFIFVVREGAVHLFEQAGPEERQLIEQCDEGDVFGLRALLAGRSYRLTAETVEETLLYAVPTEGLEELLADHPQAALYLAVSFAADERPPASAAGRDQLLWDQPLSSEGSLSLVEIQSAEQSKEPVTCRATDRIRDAAQRMSDAEVGSIIITDQQGRPAGIVTDKDLRKKVATGWVDLHDPVSAIMSAPVITIPPHRNVADVQIAMVKHRIHHLCITEDGTDRTPVVGVISEHDLLVLQGNNPAVLIRETRRCKNAEELRLIRERAESLLRKYLYQGVGMTFISTVMSEINDAVMARAIRLAEEELAALGRPQPAARFCWLALGSEGRGEQLLRTDQDNALVFEDVSEAELPGVKDYYLTLARRVNEMLYIIGFEYCPGEMMAGNPKWCLSVREWRRQFSQWIDEPTPQAVMMCTIFFDYRPVYGRAELAQSITEHIFDQVREQSIFLSFLARDALQNPPPLTFFRQFMVEKSGEHRDEFDIKLRAMMPLADAARTLVLAAGIGGVNHTPRRFEKLAEREPQNRALYEEAARAYEILMRYRTMQGLQRGDSGRYFSPSELSKIERLHLRNSFTPIRELQSLLRVRFKLSLMT